MLKMTAYDLKRRVEEHGNSPHFFTRRTMGYFGDTMKNYGVRTAKVRVGHWIDDEPVLDAAGNIETIEIDAWELYRIHPVKHGLTESAYFDTIKFAKLYPVKT